MHFDLEKEPLHSSFSKLQSDLNAIQDKGHVKLSIANSLWAQEEYHFLDSFFDLNKKYYGTGLKFVDFKRQTERARKTINVWVEKETQDKIKELIKRGMLSDLTTLVLCNAIYFKGDRQRQFNKERTEAAAATAVVMQRLSVSKPLTFRADHPFVFFIREIKTGSILFIGRISDPTK